MKILEIIPQLSSGGAERFAVDLCNEIADKHDVTLVMLHPFKGLDFYRKDLSPRVKLISLNKKRGVDILLPFKVYKLIQREKFDVVHTHLRGIVYSSLAIMVFHKHIKFIHTLHNDAFKEAGKGVSSFVRKFLFSTNRSTPVTISEASENSFSELYGFSATLIPNGRNIPPDLSISAEVKNEIDGYKKDKDTRVLINLARFEPQKRQPLLARVASRLSKDGYNFTVLLIGNKRTLEMVSEVESVHCPSIHILGERSNPLEYLKAADAYCLCSAYEGMPISLIEAMGVGTVPVCTPVGGIVDVIKNGVNGYLSSDISEEAYYESLKTFLELEVDEIITLKSKVHESYAPYSMTQCAMKYINLFNQKTRR